jgi:hypothetical protein
LTHYFTPEEANKILPQVREIIQQVVALKKTIDSVSGRSRNMAVDQLGTQISKLEEIGVELKDMDTGLIDFPADRFGETVELCWKLGEDQVLYWHRPSEGFRGRKLLKPEPLEAK